MRAGGKSAKKHMLSFSSSFGSNEIAVGAADRARMGLARPARTLRAMVNTINKSNQSPYVVNVPVIVCDCLLSNSNELVLLVVCNGLPKCESSV